MQEMIRCLKQKDSDFMVSLSVCVCVYVFFGSALRFGFIFEKVWNE